jgi:hypothetical protein
MWNDKNMSVFCIDNIYKNGTLMDILLYNVQQAGQQPPIFTDYTGYI